MLFTNVHLSNSCPVENSISKLLSLWFVLGEWSGMAVIGTPSHCSSVNSSHVWDQKHQCETANQATGIFYLWLLVHFRERMKNMCKQGKTTHQLSQIGVIKLRNTIEWDKQV